MVEFKSALFYNSGTVGHSVSFVSVLVVLRLKQRFQSCFHLFQVHAYIISSLQRQMPSMFGKDTTKKNLIKALDATFAQIEREHNISKGDFPDLKKMQENLKLQDFTKFKSLNAGMISKAQCNIFQL